MWFVVIKILTLNALINYTKCSSTLDPCLTYESDGKETGLCLKVSNNSKIISTLHSEGKNQDVITYREWDNITLTCVIMPPIIFNETYIAYFKMEHKIQGHIREVLITEYKKLKPPRTTYEIKITPDRKDHSLHATCKASGTESNVSIIFSSNVYINKDRDITEEYYTEGHSVPNTLNRKIIVYDNKSDWKIEKIVGLNTNIYDELTADKNGTIYSAWYDNDSTERVLRTEIKRNLYKKYWKIIVLSSDKASDNSAASFPTAAVLAGIIGLFAIVVGAICIHRKYVKRKQSHDDNYEHIYSEPLEVTYAQIDHKASERSNPTLPQEPYAKIIGVLKAKKKTNHQ